MTIRKKLFSIVSTIVALTMLLSFVGVFAEEQNIDESIVALNEATGELNNIYNSILEQDEVYNSLQVKSGYSDRYIIYAS